MVRPSERTRTLNHDNATSAQWSCQFFPPSQPWDNSWNHQLRLVEKRPDAPLRNAAFRYYSLLNCSGFQNYTAPRFHPRHRYSLLQGKMDTPRIQTVSSIESWAHFSFPRTSRKIPYEAFPGSPSNNPKHGPKMARTNSLPYRIYQRSLQVK